MFGGFFTYNSTIIALMQNLTSSLSASQLIALHDYECTFARPVDPLAGIVLQTHKIVRYSCEAWSIVIIMINLSCIPAPRSRLVFWLVESVWHRSLWFDAWLLWPCQTALLFVLQFMALSEAVFATDTYGGSLLTKGWMEMMGLVLRFVCGYSLIDVILCSLHSVCM